MKRTTTIIGLLFAIMLMTSNVFAGNTETLQNNFEESEDIYIELSEPILSKARQYVDGLMNAHFDQVFAYSNEGFMLCLYETLYEDSDKYLNEGKVVSSEGEQIPFWDPHQERMLRIDRLVKDGYIMEDELTIEIDRKVIASILYRIYKDKIPFKGSVDYPDTEDIALRWAGEVGLPTFAVNTGLKINPEDSIKSDENFSLLYYPNDYLKIITYAYLMFPNPYSGNYVDLEFIKEDVKDIKAEKVKELITLTRKEVMKPRLGDFPRDVLNNENIGTRVDSYQKTKSHETLKKLYQILKDSFNLFEYQDNIGYLRYKFSVCK
ncbi:hypothetical protein [Vallitalea sp.]|jgi:hypothetical protein|uniref:hypothetical protein n=1 Tax=Vallitalea sp. TaxID=1882829 RepID=UPI0025F49A3D|nr:hypothetical protein [Vallitalea sp.]MCT4687564.1 hypothetical protein [Vallitalea sp.]